MNYCYAAGRPSKRLPTGSLSPLRCPLLLLLFILLKFTSVRSSCVEHGKTANKCWGASSTLFKLRDLGRHSGGRWRRLRAGIGGQGNSNRESIEAGSSQDEDAAKTAAVLKHRSPKRRRAYGGVRLPTRLPGSTVEVC
eukprot:jgi/Bigna1/132736/aug1.18_g7444